MEVFIHYLNSACNNSQVLCQSKCVYHPVELSVILCTEHPLLFAVF